MCRTVSCALQPSSELIGILSKGRDGLAALEIGAQRDPANKSSAFSSVDDCLERIKVLGRS
jgi:hypothetical protein